MVSNESGYIVDLVSFELIFAIPHLTRPAGIKADHDIGAFRISFSTIFVYPWIVETFASPSPSI